MRPFLSLILLLFAAALPALARDDGGEMAKVKERELEDVRDRISALKESMDKSAASRDQVTGELQSAEVEISEKRIRLREIQRERDFSTKRKTELDGSIVKRGAELERETGQLSEQVRAAYMSGSQERVKLLLNQRDPATIGRLLSYYEYFNDFRAGNIQVVNGHIAGLATLRSQVAAEEARLAGLAKQRYGELTKLNVAQETRQSLLGQLQGKMATESKKIEQLAAQEKDLTRLIDELTRILSDYPISSENPFSEHKGRLTWPVAGTLLHDFGQPRVTDRLKWNGVVLAAPRGTEVRAVYHGRVVFTDWLAGMGLLVIVDHGEGYMTLYGYNETTMKKAGDWVAPGDVIATVGDSGGQSRAALYFELRLGTQPQNPRQWITRRPGS